MWLKFGIDKYNTLVAISDVPSGKTNLRCPYCGGLLVAKKGIIKEHHFVHSEETCYPVATKREVPTLPLYDNFHIQLSGKSLQLLKKLWQSFGENDWGIPFLPELAPLVKAGVIRKNPYCQPASYEFTDLGKIPIGMLKLEKFNQLQEPLLLKKLSEFERKAELAKLIQKLNLPERLVDLQLYRAQLKNIGSLINSVINKTYQQLFIVGSNSGKPSLMEGLPELLCKNDGLQVQKLVQ